MSLFKNYMKFVGYDIEKSYNELLSIQSLDPKIFNEWKDSKKWEIVNYHYKNNTLYNKKNINSLPNKWQDLPIMEKTDFQSDLDKIVSRTYKLSNLYIANTSGSSGHPFFFAKNKESHAMTWALIMNRYSWHGLDLCSKQGRFFGIPLENTSKFKERVKDFMMNRFRFSIFDMSNQNLKKHLSQFSRLKFKYLYGYVNSLVIFSRFLIKNKIQLKRICPSIKLCITTSEVLTKEDIEILKTGFGVPIINEYGVSEAGGITAFENQDRFWLLNKETQYIEIVDQNNMPLPNGKIGHIVITDLYNQAMPFIRYKVGDVGYIKKNVEIEGYNVLGDLQGRTNDNIHLPSGKLSPGLTFYYISRSILESSGVLKEFIIRQTSLDTFVFDIVSDRDLVPNEIDDIKNKMNLYLEPDLKLKINRVSSISRPPSGKLKHFYSQIDNKK